MATEPNAVGQPQSSLVILRIEGDFQHTGFQVMLEIGPDSERAVAEFAGHLPPAPTIPRLLDQWQKQHHLLGMPNRIQPQAIVYEGSLQTRIAAYRQTAQTGVFQKAGY
jgi:hypothetical protein